MTKQLRFMIKPKADETAEQFKARLKRLLKNKTMNSNHKTKEDIVIN